MESSIKEEHVFSVRRDDPIERVRRTGSVDKHRPRLSAHAIGRILPFIELCFRDDVEVYRVWISG